MTQWPVALGLVAVFLAAMPRMLRWVRSSGGKGRMGGIALGLGLAFSFLLDPAKAEAMENIEDRKRRGSEAAGQGERVE